MSRVKISNFKKFLFSLLALILISGLITAYFFTAESINQML